MRKFAGGFLLLSGLAGLTLVLIFWLPAGMNLAIMVLVGLLCLTFVWGGGELLRQSVMQRRVAADKSASWQFQHDRRMDFCPRCGQRTQPGQRFCGICGLPLGQICLRCGSVSVPSFKFCSNCGARLPEQSSPNQKVV
jgi:membrane protease subunit (stomatin/prohibitin family)